MLWSPIDGIAYAQDNGIIVFVAFTDEKEAQRISRIVDGWNENFTIMTFVEWPNDEYSLVYYQDPKMSFDKINHGLFGSTYDQNHGYNQIKSIIQKTKPDIQIIYASDLSDVSTYKKTSTRNSIGKCRIISKSDLTNQEYFYEKTAHEVSGGYKIE